MKKLIELDKYSGDSGAWRDWARINYTSARVLFTCDNNIVTCLPGATLGHMALEMFLKAALILDGCTVFNPDHLNRLDRIVKIRKDDCVWGHSLTSHAEHLASRRTEFDLSAFLKIPNVSTYTEPITVRTGFAIFDPFFSELRYPQGLLAFESVGPSDVLILDCLVKALEPFL